MHPRDFFGQHATAIKFIAFGALIILAAIVGLDWLAHRKASSSSSSSSDGSTAGGQQGYLTTAYTDISEFDNDSGSSSGSSEPPVVTSNVYTGGIAQPASGGPTGVSSQAPGGSGIPNALTGATIGHEGGPVPVPTPHPQYGLFSRMPPQPVNSGAGPMDDSPWDNGYYGPRG